MNRKMKLIPAFARMVLCGPVLLSKPATIPMPHMHQTVANSINLRQPTRSTIEVPPRAPMKEVQLLTRLSLRCWSESLIPASLKRVGKKSDISYHTT